MVKFFFRLGRKLLPANEADIEQLRGDVSVLADVLQERIQLLTRRIEGARGP